MPTHLTTLTAEAHEALHPKLAKLTRQMEALAARRADAPVPPAARAIAEALLFEALAFSTAPRALPAAAPDVAGLATQLGQALAGLDAFEAVHSGWDRDLNCFAWRLSSGGALPVRRLRPQAVVRGQTRQEKRDSASRRNKLLKHIEGKFSDGYDRGYRDAQNGVPYDGANL